MIRRWLERRRAVLRDAENLAVWMGRDGYQMARTNARRAWLEKTEIEAIHWTRVGEVLRRRFGFPVRVDTATRFAERLT